MHGDGGGLYLQVTRAGVPSWTFRYMIDGRERYPGLGPLHAIGLSEARKRAAECRRQLVDGIDPLAVKQAAREKTKLTAAKAMTFKQCAEAYIAAQQAGWRNPEHAKQWPSTLNSTSTRFSVICPSKRSTSGWSQAVEPIWNTKPEAAGRVRGRIESILDFATAAATAGREPGAMARAS